MELPYRVSVLVFIKNPQGQQLLLLRKKSPNKGVWSPVGGKLEMDLGESPFECAIRETQEEVNLAVTEKDLHLFCMIAEKSYEASGHWLMFLFDCRRPLKNLPGAIDEGEFAFYSRDEIDGLLLPETDRQALWPIYDKYKDTFVSLRANCHPANELEIVIEECQQI